ncbi:hypothetical protein TNCV_363821 [Trichonephila clavipes]|uniref:Uncharacterized protein n=1 Tax=Trichonephila clavipes TaxID=2585209 RepID=A0A8X6VMH7_TRICX|nr:hypothetical protein TNCV_363821 [Trichonephila clavipes]
MTDREKPTIRAVWRTSQSEYRSLQSASHQIHLQHTAAFPITHKKVGKPIDENSACVEVGTTHKHLRRGDKSNNFKNYFSSNDITCEEVKSVDSQRFFLHWIHRTCEQQGSQKKKDERVSQNEREVTSEQKIELAKLQLAKLEKEIELQLAKNKALSLNPAAKVEENSSKLT